MPFTYLPPTLEILTHKLDSNPVWVQLTPSGTFYAIIHISAAGTWCSFVGWEKKEEWSGHGTGTGILPFVGRQEEAFAPSYQTPLPHSGWSGGMDGIFLVGMEGLVTWDCTGGLLLPFNSTTMLLQAWGKVCAWWDGCMQSGFHTPLLNHLELCLTIAHC